MGSKAWNQKHGLESMVPVILVYEDSEGEVHKIRFLEWGASPASAAQA